VRRTALVVVRAVADIIEIRNENVDWIEVAAVAGFCEHDDGLCCSVNEGDFLISEVITNTAPKNLGHQS
jgi:hypothetical protein